MALAPGDTTTPLPPTSTRSWPSRLRLAVTRLHRRLRQQSLAGLSPAQASALGAVNRLGSPTLGELAAIEQVQPPTMTRIVATLEDAGTGDPGDRRRRPPGAPRQHHRRRAADARAHPDASRTPSCRPAGRAGPDERARSPTLIALLEHLVGGRAVSAVRAAAARRSSALRVRNFRLYFIAQLISVSGHLDADGRPVVLLVLHLHGSGSTSASSSASSSCPCCCSGRSAGSWPTGLNKRQLLTSPSRPAAARPGPRPPGGHGRRRALAGLRAGRPARRGQPVRQPGPADLHLRDGRSRRTCPTPSASTAS